MALIAVPSPSFYLNPIVTMGILINERFKECAKRNHKADAVVPEKEREAASSRHPLKKD
jgi:hypothetical protein